MRERVGVLIVGGGIAGLATALGLHARGVDCLVAESVREIVPLGVGINLLPHGVRVLTELGLAPALADVGVSPPPSVQSEVQTMAFGVVRPPVPSQPSTMSSRL